ncbi:MAG: peptide transporter [Phenylobacterium sp.]|jgi:POT family proton-dependent oligopeptide transporter|uniref:peptide MFS transporter n=1 Tax=Phenylobacterium sp. TaxID=1871053 RepID=UPI0026364D62|nr:oligopeptide:H+ symporter [Phenylobacterium sp.]MDB5462314.1 peptide transporter [Phenylobacterium sp.]MDB5499534.1 peptide transporter [Phenylobacterium sp.]
MNSIVLLGIVVTVVTGVPVILQLRKNHPRGLIILFFAEMWERFSYYGMRGILIFYLTQHLLFDDKTASAQYGSYTSLVYLLPLAGGIIADRWLGTRKAVAFGALLLVAGHLTMAIEGHPAQQTLQYAGQSYPVAAEGRMESRQVHLMVAGKPYEFGPAPDGGMAIKNLPAGAPLPADLPKGSYAMTAKVDAFGKMAFYIAVSLIIMGVGFLKPNISTIVGQLYPQGDPRRDSGFTLYYYGINLGAFWASVLCGLVGESIGWWAGFGLAGIGMSAGFIVFMLGRKYLEGHGEPPAPAALQEKVVGPLNREWAIYALGLLGVIPVYFLVQVNSVVGWGLGVCTVLSILYIAYFMTVKCTRVERERMGLALVLIFGAVVFFTLFEQAGTSLNLFAARNVDLMGISAAQTQSFNAGFILIFAPIFAAMWAWLAARGRDPDPTMKFGLGLVQVGLGFLVVVWAQGLADEHFRMPLFMLGLLYLLHTTGELFLSPVGLSEITKLSVASIVSFMMAVWFLSSSIAQFVGGKIAGLMGAETVGGQVLDPHGALVTSLDGFNKLGWAGVGCGVVFIAASFFIKGWANGANDARGPVQPEPIAPTLDGERQAVSPAAVQADRKA